MDVYQDGSTGPRDAPADPPHLSSPTPFVIRELAGSFAAEHGAGAAAEALMDLAIAIAEANAEQGGGPFGAVVANEDGRLVSVGWNAVLATQDSTAHAEIVAVRAAQRALHTHDLAEAPGAPLTLYTSCEPCIQCFGAAYWSGIARVVAAAPAGAAEAIGFQEGPVSDELWAAAYRDKGIRYERGFRDGEQARRPFRVYIEADGTIY